MNSDSLYDDFNHDLSTCNSLTDPRVSVHLSKDPVLPQHITEESFAKSQEWLCDLILSFNFFEEVEAKLIAEFCGPDLKKFSMTKVDKIYRFYTSKSGTWMMTMVLDAWTPEKKVTVLIENSCYSFIWTPRTQKKGT